MNEPAKYSAKHLFAIDVACGLGLEVDVGGKIWTFSALTIDQLARVAGRQRSEAVAAYEEGQKIFIERHGVGAVDGRQRLNDMNGLCFGAVHAQMGIDVESTYIKRLKVFLSLQKNHAGEIRSEADCDKFISDEQFASALCYKINLMTAGPITTKKDDGPGPDPTLVQSNTTSVSATSSDTLAGQ